VIDEAGLRWLAARGRRESPFHLLPVGRGPVIAVHPEHVAQVLRDRPEDFVKSGDEGMRGAAGSFRLFGAFRDVTGGTLGGDVGATWRRRRGPVVEALRAHAHGLDPDVIVAAVRAAVAPEIEARPQAVDLHALARRVAARLFLASLLGPEGPRVPGAVASLLALDEAVNRPWVSPRVAKETAAAARALLGEEALAAAPSGSLGALLRARAAAAGASPEWVTDELLAFYLVGGDPIASVLPAALIHVAREPVDGLPTSGSGADLLASDVLEATVRETLRLHPPVWAIGRQAARATTLGDVAVREGALVVALVWATQRHPDYYDRPDAFRPERFLGAEAARAREALCGFGLGPRRCPGRSTSFLQLRVALGTMLQVLAVAPTARVPRPRLGITLGPAGPVVVPVRWIASS